MPANLENSDVATGLEKVSFHPNLKEDNAKEYLDNCKIALISHTRKVMLKKKSNAQNSSSKASTVHEPRTSRCSSWI